MSPLYAYCLVPVLSVSLLLFFSTLLHARSARGLAIYCLSIAIWSSTLLLTYLPSVAVLGQRLAASGAFVAAAFLHAAYEFTHQTSYTLVWLAYGFAALVVTLGAFWPGLLYDPLSLAAGPLFWHAMAIAVVAATIPMVHLARAYQREDALRRVQLRLLAASGLMCYLGAWCNALLLSHGLRLPWGLLLMLGSLLLLAHVVRGQQDSRERLLLERSLLYAALAAFLSAGFLFGVVFLLTGTSEPFLRAYGIGALFLLFMAALAFEPLRQRTQEILGRRLVPDHANTTDLARALVREEQRANQAERLAELGTFVSAVAHEVRNPLGVLSAHLSLLQRGGVEPSSIEAMRGEIERASRFVDDLVRYGRPRPLDLRMIDVRSTVDLALSTARSGLGPDAPSVDWTFESTGPAPLVEADQGQLLQVFVILFENAFLALREAPFRQGRIRIRLESERLEIGIEDSGPGIPSELMPRLFQPFVTGRKRDGARSGTGLGLATARRIVERHGGTLQAGVSELGGARFDLSMPHYQRILASHSSGR